ETDNIIAAMQPGEYEHVTDLCKIELPTVQTLRKLANAPLMESNQHVADVFDALIVAMENIRSHCRQLKYEKRIQLITTLDGMIDWRDIPEVQNQLNNQNISLTVFCVGLDDINSGKSEQSTSLQETNAERWKEFISGIESGNLLDFEVARKEMQGFTKDEVLSSASFRGYLTLGDPVYFPETSLKISINMYIHSSPAKVPSAKKWSTLSNTLGTQSDERSHAVITEKTYRLKPSAYEDADEAGDAAALEIEKVVDESSIEKAYKLGATLVTVFKEVEDFLKIRTTPGMAIIGFYRRDCVPRYYMRGNTYFVLAGSSNPRFAGRAISALAHALRRNDAVALVRHVTRDNVPPKIGILIPFFAEDVDCLRFVQIAYADDVRHFKFTSLDKVMKVSGKEVVKDHPLLPSSEALDAMGNFIDSMDLGILGKDENGGYPDPENTFNPYIWRLNRAIIMRLYNPDAPLPNLDPMLQKQLEPPPKLVENSKHHVETLKRVLDIKKVDRTKKRTRYEAPGVAEADIHKQPVEDIINMSRSEAPDDVGQLLKNSKRIREISAVDPVGDFKNMISNTEEDLMIVNLVTTSFGDQYYSRSIDYLKLLRETAAKENESEPFNNLMFQLKAICDPSNPQSRRLDFWKLLKDNQITLITNKEASDSGRTPEDAEDVSIYISRDFCN
ncbi:SPOC like C-terminal domain-containing protein, partial [Dichotomocladium elegans]